MAALRACKMAYLSQLVLCLSSWPAVYGGQARNVVVVVDGKVLNSVFDMICPKGVQLKIGCGYREEIVNASNVRMLDISSTSSLPLHPVGNAGFFRVLGHTLSVSQTTGDKTYQCGLRSSSGSDVRVSLHFRGSTGTVCTAADDPTMDTPASDTPAPVHPTSDSSDTPIASEPTTASTGAGNSNSGSTSFKGLKPLIYTVASVILLGTLAIVAIITCWIRARRSFRNRVIRPNNTPQDYLDYISDNEFTPLTTSEFLASLQERPPTYNQSEDMLQQNDTSSGNTGDTSSTATSGDSATQPSGTQNASTTTSDGTVVERRRPREMGRERQRRRRRVVIVETGDTQSGDNSVTGASSQGGITVIQEESEETGNTDVTLRQEPGGQTAASSSRSNVGETTAGNNVTVLVNVQLPSLVASEQPAQRRSSLTPTTQQQIEAMEAHVNMIDVLSSPPFNSQCTSHFSSGRPTSEDSGGDNLIDFLSPPPSNLSTSSDL